MDGRCVGGKQLRHKARRWKRSVIGLAAVFAVTMLYISQMCVYVNFLKFLGVNNKNINTFYIYATGDDSLAALAEVNFCRIL